MRTLNPETLEWLDKGAIKVAELMRFDLASGSYGFWTGNSDFDYNGLTYVPGGIICVSAIPGQWGMAAQGLTIELAARPDDGLTPQVLATMEQEVWHQRPITISEAFFHPEVHALLFVEPLYRGFIDTLEYVDGTETKLVAKCESRALDNAKENYRMRSTHDQHLIDSVDNFYSHAETAGKVNIQWGRNENASAPTPPQKKRKKFLGIF